MTLINAENSQKSPYIFQMDRDLTLFSLKPKEGSSSTAEFAVQDFNMKDVASVYKDSAERQARVF